MKTTVRLNRPISLNKFTFKLMVKSLPLEQHQTHIRLLKCRLPTPQLNWSHCKIRFQLLKFKPLFIELIKKAFICTFSYSFVILLYFGRLNKTCIGTPLHFIIMLFLAPKAAILFVLYNITAILSLIIHVKLLVSRHPVT